ADPETVALRQEAVREMAAALDFRDRLAAEARLAAASAPGQKAPMPGEEAPTPVGTASRPNDSDAPTERFLRWAEGDSWLPNHRWVGNTALVLTPVNLAAIALYVVGAAPTAALAWTLLVSVLVRTLRRKAIRQVFAEAGDGESGIRRYGDLLGHLHRAPLTSRYMTRVRQRIGEGPRAAPEEIARLRRLLDLADVRRSPLFHLPLAIVLHWDVHVLAALERWKARSGGRVRDWLDAIGEAEALAALAAAAADHPDWTLPALDPDARTLRARSLGHPLLAPGTCVRNDVEVGPAGSFLLVTGSNMSGKSTLLRAVGLNAVLAQAGGPVCARELRMPPLHVVTSMRVEDSVTGGVSFFMAGLHRLKEVVDAARSAGDSPQPDSASSGAGAPRTLYLLDEILRGTNSAERRIAARTVLRHLLETDAIGAVTSHDLSLADARDLVARAVAMHFTESVGDGADGLAFDYRLRPGIATSTNALKLLEMVGLGPDTGG
ncbi:MAG: DNA mismatch repair protein MutS, partial [Gemmatimonadetes bacterium]|nr:DNA mismatch repair protein MutS [Gemmatimonadota bacterium]